VKALYFVNSNSIEYINSQKKFNNSNSNDNRSPNGVTRVVNNGNNVNLNSQKSDHTNHTNNNYNLNNNHHHSLSVSNSVTSLHSNDKKEITFPIVKKLFKEVNHFGPKNSNCGSCYNLNVDFLNDMGPKNAVNLLKFIKDKRVKLTNFKPVFPNNR